MLVVLWGRGGRFVGQVIALLSQAERGYRGILIMLGACDISKHPPEFRVAASISRAAHQYAYLRAEVVKTLKGRTDITLASGPYLIGEDATPVSPDAVLAGIVDATTMTIQMEARKNRWLDSEGHIVLPTLPAVTANDRYKAGSTELLALCWRQWRRTEQRLRFRGGTLQRYIQPELPVWAPKKAKEVSVYDPSPLELSDWIANERLNDRFVHTYMTMALKTNIERDAKGIASAVPLLPAAFVSPQEAHAGA